MAVKFPTSCNIKLTYEDRQKLENASQKIEIPASTLVRKVLRDWLRSNESANDEKQQPQMVNPPAA